MPKISELPAGSAPSGAEKIPAVQSGQTVYLTPDQLRFTQSVQNITTGAVTISDTTTHAIVNRTGPSTTALAMPNAATRGGRPLSVIDLSQSVTGHTITLTPAIAAQKIMRQSTWQLFSNSVSLASATFIPVVDPDDATNYVWVMAP